MARLDEGEIHSGNQTLTKHGRYPCDVKGIYSVINMSKNESEF